MVRFITNQRGKSDESASVNSQADYLPSATLPIEANRVIGLNDNLG
jgi:hypothetical protein